MNKENISRRNFIKSAGLGSAALVFGGCSGQGNVNARDDLPNIILCMSDDQGWGDTAYNGRKNLKTPHLDAMAKLYVTNEQRRRGEKDQKQDNID